MYKHAKGKEQKRTGSEPPPAKGSRLGSTFSSKRSSKRQASLEPSSSKHSFKRQASLEPSSVKRSSKHQASLEPSTSERQASLEPSSSKPPTSFEPSSSVKRTSLESTSTILTSSSSKTGTGSSCYDPAYIEWKTNFLERSKEDFTEKYQRVRDVRKSYYVSDFYVLKALGAGAFGRVFLVRYKNDDTFDDDTSSVNSTNARQFALKVLEKKYMVKQKQVENAIREKNVLQSITFPFVTRLECAFKDNANVFMVLEYVDGGDVFSHLSQEVRRFTETQARFLASHIILGFEYMHHLDLVHRDLKPENVLLGSDGYAKLTDFGFVKPLKGRTYTLCGTPEYLAPEVLLNKGYGKAVDWWAVGIFIYELIAGKTPYDMMSLFQNILDGRVSFPKYFSEDLKDLLGNMIQEDLTKRYGNMVNGADDIKAHPWFSSVDWLATYEKTVPAPYRPIIKRSSDDDFAEHWDEIPLAKSDVEQYRQEFDEF